ncbi:LOW QUALITY PROTEIN: hypothetical protein HID58_065831 [Brassica napus]|uniref:Uncharacterized protein n=1 Tax=Brassica napus TaxID=3708 RepID=A0ABQ7ZEF0_BRANA|nr:LOW QUALITY PROTEIN: hypothetical protein HID58_065831 [Brassica napus]
MEIVTVYVSDREHSELDAAVLGRSTKQQVLNRFISTAAFSATNDANSRETRWWFQPSWSEQLTSRYMYERTTEKLADDEEAETLLWRLLKQCKEPERARFIYKFSLDHIPTWRADDLYKKFVAFEKQYGGKEEIEDATAGKRRFQYEDEVRKNPLNYDSWFDYVRLEEPWGTKIGILLECWVHGLRKMLIILRIRRVNYALYGETETEDICGNAIRKSPKKDKWSTENCYAWRKYAELERSLAETERSRVIFELAISQPALDIPELLWKRTRALYERLLDPHKALQGVAVWEEEDQEEIDAIELKKECIRRVRAIFERATSYYKDSAPELKEA